MRTELGLLKRPVLPTTNTVFGLLKAPELQRLSVTVEVLRVGVMIVGVISVGVLSVGVMTLSRNFDVEKNSLCVYVYYEYTE
jgi:hypothetical protein